MVGVGGRVIPGIRSLIVARFAFGGVIAIAGGCDLACRLLVGGDVAGAAGPAVNEPSEQGRGDDQSGDRDRDDEGDVTGPTGPFALPRGRGDDVSGHPSVRRGQWGIGMRCRAVAGFGGEPAWGGVRVDRTGRLDAVLSHRLAVDRVGPDRHPFAAGRGAGLRRSRTRGSRTRGAWIRRRVGGTVVLAGGI